MQENNGREPRSRQERKEMGQMETSSTTVNTNLWKWIGISIGALFAISTGMLPVPDFIKGWIDVFWLFVLMVVFPMITFGLLIGAVVLFVRNIWRL